MNTSGHLESLEVRRLFVVSTFNGTDGDDVIQIGVTDTGYYLNINGKRTDVPVSDSDPDKAFYLYCQYGNDRVTVDPKYKYKMIVSLGSGNDYFSGSDSTKAHETVVGDAGRDSIYGNGGSDAIYGGTGNDYIDAGTGDDAIVGDLGGDIFYSGKKTYTGGNDTILCGAGADTVDAGAGNDSVVGGDGNDFLCGNTGNDTILGGAGDDYFNVSRRDGFTDDTYSNNDGGDDLFDGGKDIDQIRYYANDAITITTDGIANDGMISHARDQLLNLETFHLYADGASTFDASESPVGVSVDIHSSDLGNYTAGAIDTILGSAFADNINAENTGGFYQFTPLHIEAGAGNDNIMGASGNDVILGGVGNDTIRGYLGNDHLEGNAGNDWIQGEGGKDSIYGNKGKDYLFGGGGNDLLYGGPDDSDSITGGDGTDRAAADDKDNYLAVEIKI